MLLAGQRFSSSLVPRAWSLRVIHFPMVWSTNSCFLSTSPDVVLRGNEDYRKFVDSLLKTNVSDYISLPTIASMGDTSSGKTSVLSSLTNIELPSSDQLTTRCPIMLQMRHSSSKLARVSVTWKDAAAYPHFGPLEADESNWADLTSMIELAQQHIIEATKKEVARDVVVVDLQGPNCVNLTVVDLPGIVRTSGRGESEMLSNLTQTLIAEYMANPRCVILAIHPANVDFHNSSIMADAKKLDPETKRTLPVLTKPDLIDPGAEKSVVKLLLGEKTDKFEQGFHMVKSRGQAALDRGDSIEEGLDDELNFFVNTKPWSTIPNRSLFGIPNLRHKLGDLQMRMARDTFPDILAEISREKEAAEIQLSKIGAHFETSAEMRIFYSEACERTSKVLQALLSGNNTRVLHFDVHLPSARFHDECLRYRDKLRMGRLYAPGTVLERTKVIITYRGAELKGTCIRIEDDKYYFEIPPGEREAVDDKIVESLTRHGVYKDKVDMEVDPRWLSDLIKSQRSYKVPVFANDEIFEKIVAKFLEEDWLHPSLDLVGAITEIIKDSVDAALDNDPLIPAFPRLKYLLKDHIDEQIDVVMKGVQQEVIKFVKREKIPYTQNHYLNETLTSLRAERILAAATQALTDLEPNRDTIRHYAEEQAGKIEAALKSVAAKLKKKSIEDHMAEEMQDALKAYGKVAYKRFIDCVPIICGDAMLNCPEQIRESLGKVPQEEIDNVLSLSPSDVQYRKGLEAKVGELEKGLQILRDLR